MGRGKQPGGSHAVRGKSVLCESGLSGVSMGGYGALYNGILNHGTFGYIVALSSALVMEKAWKTTYEHPSMFESRLYFERCFGDLDKLPDSNMHLQTLIKEKMAEGAKLPEIYMACGKDDSLLGVKDGFAAFLKECNIPVTYEVGAGDHEWNFWDAYIKKGMEWLPLEQVDRGIHSGNIGE